ncbi:MAG TPA: DUF2846 domain-containing protein [Allosphingosinicella sp.]|jgi:hypothetical protein
MKLTKMMAVCALAALAVPAQAAAQNTKKAETKTAAAVPAPPPGMGQVVFYRSSMMGALISCRVHENGEVVNKLPPGKYFIHQTTPGAHEYSVKSEAKDTIRVEVEEGETQYVRCAIGMGIGVGRPNLSPQSRADFDKRGKGLDLLPPYKGERDKDDDSDAKKGKSEKKGK